MIYLIIGGSASGKSEYAEKAAVSLREKNGGELYYVASMYPYDEECQKKISRHRQMRAGKGFTTIECYTHMERLAGIKAAGEHGGCVYLLECMSNLLANEMYREKRLQGMEPEDIRQELEELIVKPVKNLASAADCVVVTNEVFSDGFLYEEETEKYRRMLGYLNRALAREADSVVEVVCGIPTVVKGEPPC